MSSSPDQQAPTRPQRRGPASSAPELRAALGLCALALAASSVACASRDTYGPVEALARATSTPTLQSAVAMDKARIMQLISIPGEEFSISFTQSPELNQIAERLPAFQSALRERESTPEAKARR